MRQGAEHRHPSERHCRRRSAATALAGLLLFVLPASILAAEQGNEKIVGTWDVQIIDPDTGDVVKAIATFFPGGSSRFTTAHDVSWEDSGVWRKVGGHSYVNSFYKIIPAAAPNPPPYVTDGYLRGDVTIEVETEDRMVGRSVLHVLVGDDPLAPAVEFPVNVEDFVFRRLPVKATP